ncbi:MAG: hypothetical protein KKF46_04005 [Nanoarchaeota archaeon]|nr:hypothetical protein [Nanoarchaeota archaeon]
MITHNELQVIKIINPFSSREIKKRILLRTARHKKKLAITEDKERITDRKRDPSFEYRWFGTSYHNSSINWLDAGRGYFEAAELTLKSCSQQRRYAKALSCYKHFFVDRFQLENIIEKDTSRIIATVLREPIDITDHFGRLYNIAQQMKNEKLTEITSKILTHAPNMNVEGSLEDYINKTLPKPGEGVISNPVKRLYFNLLWSFGFYNSALSLKRANDK